jgi:hypothetical protein
MASAANVHLHKQALEKLQDLRVPCNEREFFRYIEGVPAVVAGW